jgi:WD40 repeat protein
MRSILFPIVNKKWYLRIFTISCVIFFLAGLAGFASASEPQWSHDTKNVITSLSLSGDGKYIAAATANNKIYFFNQSGTVLWWNQSIQKISAISLPANGQYIGVGGSTFAVFRPDGDSVFTYNIGNPVKDVEFFQDGKYVAFMDLEKMSLFTREGGALWSYSVKGDKTSRDLEYRHHIAVPDDGSVIIFSPPWAKKMYGVNLNGNWKWVTPIDGYPQSIAISPNGNYILVGTDNSTASLISSEGKILWVKQAFEPVTSVALSFDGSYIAYGGRDNIVNFLKSDGSFLWKKDLFSQIDAIAVTNDGSYIVAGTEDNKIHVFKSSGDEYWQYTVSGVSGISGYLMMGSTLLPEQKKE